MAETSTSAPPANGTEDGVYKSLWADKYRGVRGTYALDNSASLTEPTRLR